MVSYEIFESLKRGQPERVINKELEQSQEFCSRNNNLDLGEENREEMKEESSSDGSISSFSNNGEEIDSEIPQDDYASLRNEIKELRNDLRLKWKRLQHLWIWLQIHYAKSNTKAWNFSNRK